MEGPGFNFFWGSGGPLILVRREIRGQPAPEQLDDQSLVDNKMTLVIIILRNLTIEYCNMIG